MMSEFEFVILILSFTAYYFIERFLRIILAVYHPSFYEKMRLSRKDLVFFGMWMGLLISASSTPFCALAARKAWYSWRQSPLDGQQGGEWPVDLSSKVCVASRAIIWVSELNRLDMYGLYIVHHTGSIASLLSFIYFRWPPAIMFQIYTTLVSEIPGDLVWMVSSYVHAAEQSSPALLRFKYHLVRFNFFQYTLIRGAGIALAYWMLLTNSPGLQGRPFLEQAYAYTTMGLYSLFCAVYVFRQHGSISSKPPSFESAGKEAETCQVATQQVSPRPIPRLEHKSPGTMTIHFGKFPPIILVPYGFFMGIGFAALVLISLTIGAPSYQDREGLSFAINLCLVFAVVFARLLSIFMEDGAAKLISMPIRTLFRPGFWLHGGLFGTAAGALLSYKLGYIKNFSMFAGSLAVGLPLYEAFSRIGCHTYGCCYGRIVETPSSYRVSPKQTLWHTFPYPAVRYSHPTAYAATRLNPKLLHVPLIPVQLISATLFFLLFLCTSFPLSYYIRVEVAGAGSLIGHGAIRLVTESYRADYRGPQHYGLSATGKMALIQTAGAFLWLCSLIVSEEGLIAAQRPDWDWTQIEGRLVASLSAAALGIVVYGVHIGQIGSWTG